MEDIISLNLVKTFFDLDPSSATDKYALNILMGLEDEIVNYYTENGHDNNMLNGASSDLVSLVEKDNVFVRSHKKFIEQHNLQIHTDIYNTLPYAVVLTTLNMRKGKVVKAYGR